MVASMSEPWCFDVLPCRPPPHAGECLSGYLLRLADANGLRHFTQLTDGLFPRWQKSHHPTLLRWEYPVEDWGHVPLRTQLTVADLHRLTVAPWLEKFRPPLRLRPPRASSPGGALRGIIHPQLQVCPLCLQEQPYTRLLWRLQPVAVCLNHGCVLQARCQRCHTDLAPVSTRHRHLHCPVCDADLRTLPVVAAPPEMLAAQQPRQVALRFLLDPDTTLVRTLPSGPELPSATLSQAVGMKFRYLRSQAGISVADMASRLNAHGSTLTALELGDHAALPLYLTYLEALALSWPEFATLEVPPTWLATNQTPQHMQLRLCPTPDCPNHQPPPTVSVNLLADLPEHAIARFRCTRCGRSFTRSYTGRLMGKPRRPPIQPGEPPTVPKSPAEVARLVELGLQGCDNREIAWQLGWGEKTVRMYWISLDLETQVHQAQAQRRTQEKLERRASLRVCIDAALQPLLVRDEKISARQVSCALGFNADYLNTHRLLAAYVQEQVQAHNRQVAERRGECLRTRIADILAELPHCEVEVTFREVAQAVGLSDDHLRTHYPELHALVRAALSEHLARLKMARSQAECARINEAAARLATQGQSLSVASICRVAGLPKYRRLHDPTLQALLHQWIDDDVLSD